MTAVERKKLEALIRTWRVHQLEAYHTAKRAATSPLHAHPAMHESTTIAKCANELEALLGLKPTLGWK